MNNRRGFTIVEVLISIIVLTVGLLGLVTTAALVTRMIARGQRSAVAAMFAAQRLERLRTRGCVNQAGGSDTLYRGSAWVAINSWTFTAAPQSTWRLQLVTTYKTIKNQTRSDTAETAVTCLF